MANILPRWEQNFENHLISDSATWMEMIKRRNDTSHTYDEDTAAEVVLRVKDFYYQAFVALFDKMKKLVSETPNDLFS